MTTTYTVGDLERPLSGTLTDGGVPLDLTAATGVTVHIRRPDRTVIARPATVAAPATGVWSMPWQAGDLNAPGNYALEVQVMWGANRPQTFGPITFVVREQIA